MLPGGWLRWSQIIVDTQDQCGNYSAYIYSSREGGAGFHLGEEGTALGSCAEPCLPAETSVGELKNVEICTVELTCEWLKNLQVSYSGEKNMWRKH